jgi:DNA-binding NarL/FixJ family response regulator
MRLLIADDQAKVRSALRLWLGRQAGIQVLGEAVDARGVIDWVTAACPDAVLLDWELPGRDDLNLVLELRKRCPSMAIIALSGRGEARAEAWAAGADVFVSKGEPPEHLLVALQAFGCQGA